MSQTQIESFLALAIGFAIAGLVASVYRALRDRPASFNLLLAGGPPALAAIPLLVVAGPAIIMRNTLRGRRYERRAMHFVVLSTIVASFWAIVTGYQILRMFQG